ncbi:conserved hypothetical protein, partial [Ricinus communis]
MPEHQVTTPSLRQLSVKLDRPTRRPLSEMQQPLECPADASCDRRFRAVLILSRGPVQLALARLGKARRI